MTMEKNDVPNENETVLIYERNDKICVMAVDTKKCVARCLGIVDMETFTSWFRRVKPMKCEVYWKDTTKYYDVVFYLIREQGIMDYLDLNIDMDEENILKLGDCKVKTLKFTDFIDELDIRKLITMLSFTSNVEGLEFLFRVDEYLDYDELMVGLTALGMKELTFKVHRMDVHPSIIDRIKVEIRSAIRHSEFEGKVRLKHFNHSIDGDRLMRLIEDLN